MKGMDSQIHISYQYKEMYTDGRQILTTSHVAYESKLTNYLWVQ